MGKYYPGVQVVITSRIAPPFASRKGSRPLYLCSPRFALLREEFINPPRRHTGACRNVLLTLGGSEPFQLTTLLSEALLETLSGEIKINAVLGPYFTGADALNALAARSEGRLVVHRAPFNLFLLMAEADVAVCAGGQTLVEMAAMGVPAVVVQMAENQVENIHFFVTAGSAVYAGRASERGIHKKVAGLIGEMTGNAVLRAKMSSCGQKTIDGRGARRAAEMIIALCGDFYKKKQTSDG